VLGEGEFECDAYVLFGRSTSDDFAMHADTVSVERWHAAAIDHGGTDDGARGIRPEYSGRYYAAFALDPDGNNVEAVFHTPGQAFVWHVVTPTGVSSSSANSGDSSGLYG
jgi:hypothetical protein